MHKSDSICIGRNSQKPKKEYTGKRSYGECFVTVNGRALDPRFDLRFHSPDGFEWGYAGSGPAQLALALLADHLADDSRALALYQDFKREVVASLPHAGWILKTSDIYCALVKIQDAVEGPGL